MNNWNKFCRQVVTFALSKTPLGSYGELVLRPVTMLEQAAGTEIAFSTAYYKK